MGLLENLGNIIFSFMTSLMIFVSSIGEMDFEVYDYMSITCEYIFYRCISEHIISYTEMGIEDYNYNLGTCDYDFYCSNLANIIFIHDFLNDFQ